MNQNSPNIRYVVVGRREVKVHPRFHASKALLFCRIGAIQFVTQHPIECAEDGKPAALGAGVPLSAESLGDLMSELQSDAPVWVDERLLAVSRDRILWWLPPGRRPLWIVCGHQRKRFIAPWPGLVLMMQRRGGLRVFAVNGNERPKPGSPLFHAPLMNVHGNGDLCFGGVDIPEFGAGNRHAFERALIDSRSTHVNHPRTFRIARNKPCSTEEHLRLWESLQSADSFPVKLLVRIGATLEEVIESGGD